MRQSTICCVGYSRLPSEMTAAQVYGTLGVGLEVDPQSGEVVDAAITLVSEMAWRFFAATMIGQNLEEGIEDAIADIEATYFGTGKKAIIHATREAYARYVEFRSSTHNASRSKPKVVNLNERNPGAE
jgi:hypothetical protein